MSDPERACDVDRLADFRALVKRADTGDEAALTIVKHVFAGVSGIWDAYGNLAKAAEAALIKVIAGNSELTRVGLKRHLAGIRTDLTGPDPSPLERLLVERVVACWLHSQQADLAYARSLEGSTSSDCEHYQRRQDRAARLYLKSLRTLATVRRLLVAPMQVNIGERQVNIAAQNVHVDSGDS